MIYERNMLTEQQAAYNFRIWKLVSILAKLKAISPDTAALHVCAMHDSKMSGLLLDLERCTLGIDRFRTHKF